MRQGRNKSAHDHDLLRMALIGYESAKEAIEQKIAEIRKSIRRPGAIAAAVEKFTTDKPKKRRKLSAAGRKRIAAAQKKRWAEKRNAEKPATKTKPKGKRPKLSAAERAKLSGGQAVPS